MSSTHTVVQGTVHVGACHATPHLAACPQDRQQVCEVNSDPQRMPLLEASLRLKACRAPPTGAEAVGVSKHVQGMSPVAHGRWQVGMSPVARGRFQGMSSVARGRFQGVSSVARGRFQGMSSVARGRYQGTSPVARGRWESERLTSPGSNRRPYHYTTRQAQQHEPSDIEYKRSSDLAGLRF